VFASAFDQQSASKMQIAAEIVDLRQCAIVIVLVGQWLCLGQRGKGLVQAGGQSIGCCATYQRTTPVGIIAGDRQCPHISFESLGAAACVLLKIADEYSQFERVLGSAASARPRDARVMAWS
jgi:hypothetical protein